jgi:acetyl-CoA carboxylase biotin carboxyl carrier protein
MSGKQHIVAAPITGTIWKITSSVGTAVTETDTVIIMESMKMEMPIEASYDGTIVEIHVKEGQPIAEGAPLFAIRT